MSRSLERASAAPAPNTLHGIWVVPADHKYELVGANGNSDGAHAATFLLLRGTTGRDQLDVASGEFVRYHQYSGMVFYAGESLNVYVIVAAGTAVSCEFDYIDVDYTT